MKARGHKSHCGAEKKRQHRGFGSTVFLIWLMYHFSISPDKMFLQRKNRRSDK